MQWESCRWTPCCFDMWSVSAQKNSVIQKMCQSLAFRLRSLWSYALDYTLTLGRVSRRGERPVPSFGGKRRKSSRSLSSISSHPISSVKDFTADKHSPETLKSRTLGARSCLQCLSVVTNRLWHAFLIQMPFLASFAGGGVPSEMFRCVCLFCNYAIMSESTRDLG